MYELESSRENIEKTLISDVLGRNGSIFNFLKLIYSINSKSTISIDGDWGTGKTFFVKQLELVINTLNKEDSEISDDTELKKIICEFRRKLEELNIKTEGITKAIYYNACEYDYFDDPIITIIADIINKNNNININDQIVKESIGSKLDKLISSFKFGISFQGRDGNTFGMDFQKTANQDKKKILDKIIEDKEIETIFNQLLEELLVEQSNRLVIFIDELDRCKPDFAVKLLERIKYFFNDERFIFVFSTNINQLQYTIEKYYGNNFNGSYYLQKFFDYQLELPEVQLQKYIDYEIGLIPKESSYYMDKAIREVLAYKKFNLRDSNKYFELLKLKYNKVKEENTEECGYFFLCILYPVLLALKIKDKVEYDKIKSGEGKDKFLLLILNCKAIIKFMEEIINKEISEGEINQIYEFMFINIEMTSINIGGNFFVSRNIVNKMKDLLSYLGEKVIL